MTPFIRSILRHLASLAVGIAITGAVTYAVCLRPTGWQEKAKADSRWGNHIETILGIELPSSVWERPLNPRGGAWSVSFDFPSGDFKRIVTALGQEQLTLAEFEEMVETDDFSEIQSHLIPPDKTGHGLRVKTLIREDTRNEFYLTPDGTVIVVVYR